MSYREGETGGRGKGQWLWKLPVVDLAGDDIKDAKGCQEKNGGILNHGEGVEEAEFRIGKPNALRMPTTERKPIKDANPIKDARLPALENGGILNQGDAETIEHATDGNLKKCIHNHSGGKGCYVCDPTHPHRLREGAKA